MTKDKQTLASILTDFSNFQVDFSQMSEAQAAAYRNQLNSFNTVYGTKMAETSTKDHIYDDDKIKEYIQAILEDGFNLNETVLSDYPEFVDAQRLRRWTDMIQECVRESSFGAKFNVACLKGLRTNISRSKTLHDLRRSVTLMIQPLQLWNDHVSLQAYYSKKSTKERKEDYNDDVSALSKEIIKVQSLSDERKRVLDSLLEVYDEGSEDIQILRNCESAKKQHNLSDTQAAEMFGISRSYLLKLRKNVILPPFISAKKFEQEPKEYWDNLMAQQRQMKMFVVGSEDHYPAFEVGQEWVLENGKHAKISFVTYVPNSLTVYSVVYKDSEGKSVVCNETGQSLDESPSLSMVFISHK